MGKYSWTEESVLFMCRAAERSGYRDALVKHMLPHLSGLERVYEPGCGTGDLSLALAPHVRSIVSADIDPLPLQALRRRILERGIENITVREGDAFTLETSDSFDTAVFCFFGMPEQILAFCRKNKIKNVFIIKRAYPFHRFSAAEIPITGDSLEKMRSLLQSTGVPYEQEVLRLEMGQPLKDLEEARCFFKLYNRDPAISEFSDEFLLSRLEKSGDAEFPYFLPARKDVGLIHFTVEDIC